MNSGVLSQEEIDALLRGDAGEVVPAAASEPELTLSSMEADTLGEVANISMGTAATTLSTLLGKRVEITTPRVRVTTKDQLQSEYPLPYLVVKVSYTSGFEGTNLLALHLRDAAVIADLMMGGSGENVEEVLSDICISAVGEAMNQMMGTASTSMSQMFNKTVNISPPELKQYDFGHQELNETLDGDFQNVAQISFRMVIEDLVDSELMQIVPISFAKELAQGLIENYASVAPAPPAPEQPRIEAKDGETMTVQNKSAAKQVTVQPIQFAPFDKEPPAAGPGNIDLIMDVPLQLTVELGKTKKTIKEILELGPGSIIELDKLAGEPVDLLINGKLIAHGEVVVIDENYGVRVTDIVSPIERMTNLQ